MAFIDTIEAVKKERFSLLLLEPGEIYFEDYSVYLYPLGLSEEDALKKKQRGRLKVCSKSILFDPCDIALPILKFLLKDISSLSQWKKLSKLDKGNVIAIQCNNVIEMKEGNVIAPYVFRRQKVGYLFSLNYVSVDDCLPQICQLHRASTLPSNDQASMIAAIVLSRQSRVKFDTSWLEDLQEKIIMKSQGDRITPLVTNPGRIMLTSLRLYFQPFNNAEPYPVLKIKLSSIRRIIKRRFLLQHVGLEIFCGEDAPNCHLFLSLKTSEDRNELYDKILAHPGLQLDCLEQENMTLQWQNGSLSNFDYLMYLNSMADRSFNDLTQYPVFPWIIADYSSAELDLTNPEAFRDLSKPIGALNPERLERLKERYHEMPEPKFLYGSHYSTPGFVLYYLVRKAPEYMLCLQNGRFDQPDRMFNSVPETWKNCIQGAADFKELIPEFYMSPSDFLLNSQNLNFGIRQDGTKVNHVILPQWAKDSDDFVTKLREAIESEYVSKHLHCWIDLIFGYQQKGNDAILADNVFYYLTYEGAVNLPGIRDLSERDSLTVQIMEFGQTSTQLFTRPHPQRFSSSNLKLTDDNHLLSATVQNEISETKVLNSEEEVISFEKKSTFWHNMGNLRPSVEHNLHKGSVTGVQLASDMKSIFSVSKDELMKIYSIEEKRQLRSVHLSNMALSSCVVMPDMKTVIIGSWDSNVYIYSVEFGKVSGTSLSHYDAVSSVCWRNNKLVSGCWDSCVRVWKFNPQCPSKSRLKSASSDLLAELDHESGVSCVDLNSESTMLVSGTKDGQVNVWDIDQQYNPGPYQAHSDTVNAVAFSPDSQRILSCGSDHYMRVFDVATGTEIFAKDAGEELRCVCWNGCTVLAGGNSGQLIIWDLIKVTQLPKIPGHMGAITCMDISPDGNTVVTGGEDNKVILWRKT